MNTERGRTSVLGRFLFEPAPARRLATLRLLVGAYCVVYLLTRASALSDFSHLQPERFEPVGLARVLHAPLPQALVWVLWGACLLCGLAFTCGARFRVSGPAFALLFAWVTSYRNSWGMIFHNDNLPVLHVIVLGLSAAGEALALGRGVNADADEHARFRWPIRLLCIVTVITYCIAGLAKLRLTGFGWLDGEVLRGHIAADTVRKLLIGSVHSPFGLWAVRFHWPFALLGPLTLVLELGAPLSLLGRRVAASWAVCAWAFHCGVALMMAIAFPYPMSGVAFASFFAVERIWEWGWLRRQWLRGQWLRGQWLRGKGGPASVAPPHRE